MGSLQNPNNNYSDTEQLSRQGRLRGQAQQTTMLPPEHLTEFQKFIASTYGPGVADLWSEPVSQCAVYVCAAEHDAGSLRLRDWAG